jgi:2-polyprenyl-3-methyl-5-hydroxy-6-metoxy-1,4-benzoquinol methylase
MDRNQVTFETWNKVASLYHEKFMNLEQYNDSYDKFCELVEKQGAAVFEVGCGPGNITRYLLNKRPDFQIHAIDYAPKMVELARINNPGVQCSIMDCRSMGEIQAVFDAVISGFCIPYLSREETSGFFKDCAKLLLPEGVLYFSAIKGDYHTSGYMKGSSGDEAYVYYYDEDLLQALLFENRFRLLNVLYKNSNINGRPFTEMIFIARKN